MSRRTSVAVVLVAVLALCGGAGLPARANGVPQMVKLTYLEGVSNWGPKDAEGVLQFSFAEAYARLEVKNLKPVDGYSYEAWLVAPDGAALRVGPVAPKADGVATVEAKLENLARYDYNLVVVAGRAAAAKDTALPAQKSIAGRFTVSTDARGSSVNGVRPDLLPETGEPSPGWPWGRIITTGATAGGVAVMLVGFKLRHRRKEAHR